ncbi:hypothetical protein N7468_000755 [Penicillium chermesinum]|uniref:Uncharacterized protein n=1 Tax=Penicillium chermesinum TaxID=63820 RepID=A0A9W9TZ59_9EURO|nr:uncharacterized protein N7468_000755 [Penicillium chermesinum]KAJ5249304.1 hypothetical protein N7468_000755 [Penicillium chermesinum]
MDIAKLLDPVSDRSEGQTVLSRHNDDPPPTHIDSPGLSRACQSPIQIPPLQPVEFMNISGSPPPEIRSQYSSLEGQEALSQQERDLAPTSTDSPFPPRASRSQSPNPPSPVPIKKRLLYAKEMTAKST